MESFCFVLIFTRLTAKEKKLHTICLDNEIFIKIPKRSNIFKVKRFKELNISQSFIVSYHTGISFAGNVGTVMQENQI